MKFSINSTALLKQLQHLSGIIGSSNALPILDNFLFELNKESLSISSSDLENCMKITIKDVISKDEGNICIPAKMLIETLKTFSGEELTFNIDDKKHSIEILSSSGNYKLTGHSGNEFPKMPDLESASVLELEAKTLLSIISKTLFAISSDELRPTMCGVFFQIDETGGTFVATDAHKLVKYVDKNIKGSSKTSYIVPKKPLSIIKSINPSGHVDLTYNSTNVSFSFENVVLISRLIDGKYPNFDAVIPKENPNKLLIDKDAFLSSIKRVSVFSNKTTNQIRLEMKKDKDMNIVTEDLDLANEANEKIECDYEGTNLTIGFNAKILGDVLSALNNKEIEFVFSDPNKAGIMRPHKGEEDILVLVMPCMINN